MTRGTGLSYAVLVNANSPKDSGLHGANVAAMFAVDRKKRCKMLQDKNV